MTQMIADAVRQASVNFMDSVAVLLPRILITASIVYFVIIKPYTAMQARMYPPPPTGEPATPPDIQLLSEIRDLLKKR